MTDLLETLATLAPLEYVILAAAGIAVGLLVSVA